MVIKKLISWCLIALLCSTVTLEALAQSLIDEPVTSEFNTKVLEQVDALVQKSFYDAKAMPTWAAALAKYRKQIVESKTLSTLDLHLNKLLRELKVSHTQFVTTNDEAYYFLRTLFGSRTGKKSVLPLIDYVGAITGGVNCARTQVRYVLDGSPAETAGIKIGDEIVSVNGQPYIGQLSFTGTAGKTVELQLSRPALNGKPQALTVEVKPTSRNDYNAYVQAIVKSAKVIKVDGGTIGYVHVWCGSEDAHDAIEEAMDKLMDTDGLIFDLRDGYGGNFFNDLDIFYRPPAGYPSFTTVSRNGKKNTSRMVYSKPMVTLINGGSRSGKELVAYSLKKTGRSVLVGENTAGAVLAGRLYPLNDRSALYLAVEGGDVDGITLEGRGVAPDVEVKTDCAERGRKDLQYEEALRLLQQRIAKK